MLLALIFAINTPVIKPIRQWPLSKYEILNAVTFSVSEHGVVAIVDKDEKQIVLIDKKGAFMRRVGRKGQGPGEFGYPAEIQWNRRDGVFAVFDEIESRLSYWDEAGNLVKEISLPRYRWTQNLQYPSNSNLVIFSKFIMGYEKQTPTLLSCNLETGQTQILWRHELKKPRTGTADTAMGPFSMVNEFHSRLLYGMGSHFVAVTFSDTGSIHILDFKGQSLGNPIHTTLPSQPLTQDRIRQWLDTHEAFVRRHVKIQNLHAPDYYPSIRKIMIDEQDRIWAFGFPKNPKGSAPYQIFSKQGKQLAAGKLRAPAHQFQGGHLYGLAEIDEMLFLEKHKIQFPD